MKKLMILAVVAALVGICAPNVNAQVPSQDDRESTEPSQTPTQPSQTTTPSESTQPSQSTTPSTTQQGSKGSMDSQYTVEVKSADLPAAITKSLNEKYPGYKTEKAFRGTDGTYKVKVSKGDEHQVLFFDERGEAVKMQK